MTDITNKAMAFKESLVGERRQVQVDRVNHWVNHNLGVVKDTFKGKSVDQWHKPVDIMRKGEDDCDGNVVLKGWMLRSLGVECYMHLVSHKGAQLDHMVLEVPVMVSRFLWWGKKNSSILLDNLTPHIFQFEETHYKRYEHRRVGGNQNFWLGTVNKRPSERGPFMYS